MRDHSWKQFEKTGDIKEYLKYKDISKAQAERNKSEIPDKGEIV